MVAHVSPDALRRYCRDKLGGSGTTLHYSLLFQPPAAHDALTALHALRRELDDIADECADAGVAQAKLAWWREELARLFENRPRHPVTRLLAPTVASRRMASAGFAELMEAAAARQPPARFADLDALLADCRRAGGALVELESGLLGTPAATDARALGTVLELAERLCDLGLHARRDRLPLARTDLARFGVAETDLVRGKESGAVRALLAFEAERAERLLREALAALPPDAQHALQPARIRADIALARLGQARRRGYPMLTQRLMLTPLRCLWIAWRVQREH
jgi:phytoene synthase